MKNKKLAIVIILALIIIIISLIVYKTKKEDKPIEDPIDDTPIVIKGDSEFDYNIIKQANKGIKENYMISPLSIAYALSIVNDGAGGNTKAEITKLLGNYKFNKTINVKDKISIANLLFVKDTYKNEINQDYIKLLQSKYDSDLLYDKFYSPDIVNNWISDKTFKMIPKAIDQISPDFVLGIANAIAIDVEWKDKFECSKTVEGDFTLENNTKMKTAFMNSSNDITYFENSKAKGIIKDYYSYNASTGEKTYEKDDNTIELEYIAILPNGNVQDYVNNFNKKELDDLLKNIKKPSGTLDIKYSLPKYKYDFDYKKFAADLVNLGMNDAFDPEKANFDNMINKNSTLKIYINKAIHKSHIEISENGTKAAAVTIMMFDKATAIEQEKREIRIVFDRPFIYIIKEKNSDNIWFFGTVYTPIKWEENECKENFE